VRPRERRRERDAEALAQAGDRREVELEAVAGGDRGDLLRADRTGGIGVDDLVELLEAARGGDLEHPGERLRAALTALVAVALEFWTGRRLDREGLDDDAAAAVMTGAVAGCAA
jgi:hypothetical protein